MTLARDWTQYARIDFMVISAAKKSEADIRITTTESGYWSHVGTRCATGVDKSAATMCLQDHHKKVIPRKVRHEFGHALGLFHEHQLTDSDELLIPYDEAKVYKWYADNSSWDPKKVKHNVLSKRKKDGIHTLKNCMDQFSVMLYPIKVQCLTSADLGRHFCTSESATLSVEDRLHIMRMYPGRRPPHAQATPSNFQCPMCCQRKNAGQNSTNPRFMYMKDGRCLACAWSAEYFSTTPVSFQCRECSHVAPIPFQLSSQDTWACRGCDEYTHWRPIFK